MAAGGWRRVLAACAAVAVCGGMVTAYLADVGPIGAVAPASAGPATPATPAPTIPVSDPDAGILRPTAPVGAPPALVPQAADPGGALVTRVTDSTFSQEVLGSISPTLVLFDAAWCGPCRTIGPVLDEVALEKAIKIVRLDVDENPSTPEKYSVESIPTMIVFVDGTVSKRITGAQTKEQLLNQLSPYTG